VCCNNVVCASCSRPVTEAACSVCRAARAELHGQPMSITAFAAGLAFLLLLAFALAAHA